MLYGTVARKKVYFNFIVHMYDRGKFVQYRIAKCYVILPVC